MPPRLQREISKPEFCRPCINNANTRRKFGKKDSSKKFLARKLIILANFSTLSVILPGFTFVPIFSNFQTFEPFNLN